jgi:hypothetical protein
MRLDGQPAIEPPRRIFLPGRPGLRFDALSFTSSPLVIRQPRGFAGTEKIARQRRTALPAAMSRGSLRAGERSALADTRPSVSLLPPLAWTGGRVHRFLRVAGTCAPATLLENEARHQECDPMLPATEFACPKWKSRLLRSLHICDHPRFADRETTSYRNNPCVQMRMQHRGGGLNLGIAAGCWETVRIRSKL